MTTDEKAWPYMVLVCKGCDQIGIMRFRRLGMANAAASKTSNLEAGMTCIVYGKDKQEVCRYDSRT